jgi:hypothetical protein
MTILVVIFLAYFAHAAYTIALFWFPAGVCPPGTVDEAKCIQPFIKLSENRFDVHLYTAARKGAKGVEV